MRKLARYLSVLLIRTGLFVTPALYGQSGSPVIRARRVACPGQGIARLPGRPAAWLFTVILLASLSCRSSVDVKTNAELAGARSEAEDYVRLIKHYFGPGDWEYRQAEFLYARLRSSYECWLQGAIAAVELGLNPEYETRTLGCVTDARERRDDFTSHVKNAITSPRAKPQPNSTTTITRGEEILKNVQTATKMLEFFDQLADAGLKLYERFQRETAQRRAEAVKRLQQAHWQEFEKIL